MSAETKTGPRPGNDPEKSCALILAAGKGTRMHSARPKVLHTILGEPMLGLVIRALEPFFGSDIIIVAGHGAGQLEAAFPRARFVRQEEQLGTGHAVLTAMPQLAGYDRVMVVNGDAPLLTPEIIDLFMQNSRMSDISFATITLSDPASYGRVARVDGHVTGIVEAKDYRPEIHGRETGEINAGLYSFRISVLDALLPRLRNDNKAREFYLTDLVGFAVEDGMAVRDIACGANPRLLGVNSPQELAQLEDALAADQVARMLSAGVVVHNPGQVRVSPLVSIMPGAEICGPCQIFGSSSVSCGASVGPFCVIHNSRIGQNAIVEAFSHLRDAVVGPGCRVGPFARLRPGASLEEDSHVGNFVELKNAVLGAGAKANHLSYLGDAEIGAGSNIGAGTITCNYDGADKHRTTIGKNAFIGSNSSLVAPVSIGNGAKVGAGSVITRNVPDDTLALERTAQSERRLKK